MRAVEIPPDVAENLEGLATRFDARQAGKVTEPNGDGRIWTFTLAQSVTLYTEINIRASN